MFVCFSRPLIALRADVPNGDFVAAHFVQVEKYTDGSLAWPLRTDPGGFATL